MKNKFFTQLIVAIVSILGVFISSFIIAQTGSLAFLVIPFLILAVILFYLIIRDPSLGFFLVIFFLPFERVPTYELGGINIKINTIIGFLTIIAWILALLFNGKKWKIQPNALSIPLSLFAISLAISLTQAGNFFRSVQVFAFVLFTIALSVLTVNMLSDKEMLKKTVKVLFASSIVVAIFGLFQFGGDTIGLPRSLTLLKQGYDSKVFGFPRIQAFSMEPLYLANYLLIPLSLALSYFWSQRKDNSSKKELFTNYWFLLVLSIVLLIIFILTVSRGGYLGLAVAFVVFFIYYFKRIFSLKNIIAVALALGLVFGGVAYALSKGEYRATREFLGHISLNDFNKGESVQGRLHTFKIALQAYDWHKTWGIGIGNYGPYVKNYPPIAPKTGWDIVNNQYIELLAETGLVGTTAFTLILLFLIVRTMAAIKFSRNEFYRSTLIGLLAALVGILAQYNFFSTLYIIHIWVLFGLMVGVQNLAFKEEKAVR